MKSRITPRQLGIVLVVSVFLLSVNVLSRVSWTRGGDLQRQHEVGNERALEEQRNREDSPAGATLASIKIQTPEPESREQGLSPKAGTAGEDAGPAAGDEILAGDISAEITGDPLSHGLPEPSVLRSDLFADGFGGGRGAGDGELVSGAVGSLELALAGQWREFDLSSFSSDQDGAPGSVDSVIEEQEEAGADPVPELSTMVLFGISLLGLSWPGLWRNT